MERKGDFLKVTGKKKKWGGGVAGGKDKNEKEKTNKNKNVTAGLQDHFDTEKTIKQLYRFFEN